MTPYTERIIFYDIEAAPGVIVYQILTRVHLPPPVRHPLPFAKRPAGKHRRAARRFARSAKERNLL